ncbi:MAG: urea ABC transporter permease subunit UrtB [Acidimicrobiales bacterium]
MAQLFEQLFNGLSIGSLMLLVALGLTFTFGQMGVINMAHGEFIMAGAYVPYVLQTGIGFLLGSADLAFMLSLPVAFVVAGLMGVTIERLLLRRMYNRPLDTLLATFGVSLILQQAAKDLFGAPNVGVTAPSWLRGNVSVGGVILPYTRIFILVLAIVLIVVIQLFLERRPQGRRMRAITDNRDLASISGLPVGQVDSVTFFIGSGLAGIAGVAVTLIGPIGFQLGTTYIIDAFLVVIVGGLGKLRGAVVAAFALGVLNSYTEFSTSASIGRAIVFAMVIVFLQFRPNGLVSFQTRGLTA